MTPSEIFPSTTVTPSKLHAIEIAFGGIGISREQWHPIMDCYDACIRGIANKDGAAIMPRMR